MTQRAKCLQDRITGGSQLLLAEYSPPPAADPAQVRDTAKRLSGKVHALGVSDNRQHVAMAALAAASLIAAEGVEPILHVNTRDRNRIALVSEALGAQALGIRNLLCTSGAHQTLGHFRAAKNVYDLDSIQLLKTCAGLPDDGGILGEPSGLDGAGGFCLGAVASPFADPLELQIARLVKKTQAGAHFLVTQPVYDVERFDAWWQAVVKRGIHEQVAIVAGIEPLSNSSLTRLEADERPSPRIPEAMLKRIQSVTDPAARRATAVQIALETIQQLGKRCPGLRGFCISTDGDLDAALTILEKSALGSN
jgi:methylenetetrahydrofolate reductase (NADPH)